MADTGIMATTAEVQAMAGANCSATYNAEAYINKYVAQAESYVNCVTCRNWSDAYASLNADVKKILTQAVACLAAIDVINADLSGFPSMREAETRMDVLAYKANLAISQLKEKANEDFMRKA